jgi:nucleoside 2-deoxyribosyltransferase
MKTSVPVGQTTPSAEGGIDQSTEDFRIVWTLGFAGKRLLPDMEAARQALRAELQALVTAADQEGARLVAISSLAVGGDLLFAEECLRASIPFHAMLPFDPQEFLRDNFSSADAERFRRCVAGAYHLDVAAVDVDSIRSTEDSGAAKAQAENRRDAYLDAGYRIVENSDVMLFLWDGERSGRGGTADAWGYAETLKKPVWRWDPKAKTTERARWPGIAGQGRESKRLFHAHLLPELFAAAALLPTGEVVASDTPRQTAVRARFHQLDTLAVQDCFRGGHIHFFPQKRAEWLAAHHSFRPGGVRQANLRLARRPK